MKILQGNGMCTMFLCGFEIDRKLSKHWAIESVAKYTIVIGIFEFPQFANMPTILCQPFYLSTATKRPPLISLRRMRSRPSLIPSSPLTVPTTSGGTKSPFTSYVAQRRQVYRFSAVLSSLQDATIGWLTISHAASMVV
jgi:hypothetical protein